MPEERSSTMQETKNLRLESGCPLSGPLNCFSNIHGFGGRLEPRYIFGAESLDQ